MKGIHRFLRQETAGHALPRPAPVWWKGTASLHAYAEGRPEKEAPVILLVPSLINRYYILDLMPGRSLARELSGQGNHVYLLDWNLPGPEETRYGIADYILQILLPAARYLSEKHGRPIIPLGYCMGGLFALALTCIAPELISALGLLATPWDFHADDMRVPRLDPRTVHLARRWAESQPVISGDAILSLFYWNDPWRFQEKFRHYNTLKSPIARNYFNAVEHWANDCIPLSGVMASECLVEWLHQNRTKHREWIVGDTVIDPAAIQCPTLIAAPQHDRIVTEGSSLALARKLPSALVLRPPSGHIGMITGAHRRTQLWNPLRKWISRIAPLPR